MKRNLVFIVTATIIMASVSFLLYYNRAKNCAVSSIGSPNVSAGALLNEAKTLEAKNDILGARNIYQNLVGQFVNSSEIMNWQKKLDDLNRKHKELYNTITARIQINVYENRLKCAKWSKHWPQYKKACEDLKKIAKL